MTAPGSTRTLESRLNHVFQDPGLLRRALTHASTAADFDNERLEFLGDRVLGLTVAELLLEAFPDESEGDIGRRFAQLVRAETLAEIGHKVGIDQALDHAGGDAGEGPVADATEAVIAALYLDGGYAVAAEFIARHWSPLIDRAAAPPRDAKTALQEWSQARGRGLPSYRDIGREGPDHEPLFTVEVSVRGVAPARARGASKRAAEQAAAALLLADIADGDE